MSRTLNNQPQRFFAVEVPKQNAFNRTKNFKEVVLGYTEEQALAEACRCLNCASPKCVEGCPVNVPIPTLSNKSNKTIMQAQSEQSKNATAYPPSADAYAHRKSNAKKTASSAKKATLSP
jgi:glutamate synthase (NADPH/NADH) small chain